MKKTLLITGFLFLILSTGLYAQAKIHKGMSRISGSVSYYYAELDRDNYESSAKEIRIMPAYSYLITDNIEVGGLFKFTYLEDKISYAMFERNYLSREYLLGVSARCYLQAGEFYPFAGLTFGYGFSKNNGVNNYTRQLTIDIGADYFISNAIAIEPFMSYFLNNTNEYNLNSYTFGAGVNYFITD